VPAIWGDSLRDGCRDECSPGRPRGPVQGSESLSITVMAITKCRIPAQTVTGVTFTARSGVPLWPHRRRMVRAGLMEKIMSKTPMHNSEAMSNHGRELPNQANELTTDELEHVSGGLRFNYGNIKLTYYPQKL
jgi:bacteriocin-like protein